MFHRERESAAGFATGLFAGVLFGASVALLLAPKSGSQLRGDIGDSVGSLRDAVNRRYRQIADRAGVTVDNVQDRVLRATEAFEAGARELVQSVQSAAQRVRSEPLSASRNEIPRA
ncbi:MAG: YtxH domain-containing protein [Vicinamibacterales bacterium]